MTLLKGKVWIVRAHFTKVNSRPYEEITVVKKVEGSVLLIRNVAIETEVMKNNVWRFKTYEAFKDKAINISEEYGVDFDEVELPVPTEKPVKCLDGYSSFVNVYQSISSEGVKLNDLNNGFIKVMMSL